MSKSRRGADTLAKVPRELKSNVHLNERQMRFCQGILTGSTHKQAAIDAGYSPKTAAQAARNLLRANKKVRDYIAKARAETRERTQITVQDMLNQLSEDREFAKETKNAAAMVRASEIQSKLLGMLIDRLDKRSLGKVQIQLVHQGPDPSNALEDHSGDSGGAVDMLDFAGEDDDEDRRQVDAADWQAAE